MYGADTFAKSLTMVLSLVMQGDSFIAPNANSLRQHRSPATNTIAVPRGSTSTVFRMSAGDSNNNNNDIQLSIGDDDAARLALAGHLENLLPEPANEPNVPARERETNFRTLPAKPNAEYMDKYWNLEVNEDRDNVPIEEMQDDFTIELSKPSSVEMTSFSRQKAKQDMIPLFEEDFLSRDDVKGSVRHLREMTRLTYVMTHTLKFSKHNIHYFSDVLKALKKMEHNAESIMNDDSAFKKWADWSKEHARVLHFILDDAENPASFHSIKEFVKSPAQELLIKFMSG